MKKNNKRNGGADQKMEVAGIARIHRKRTYTLRRTVLERREAQRGKNEKLLTQRGQHDELFEGYMKSTQNSCWIH
jgi:hypothetical protein